MKYIGFDIGGTKCAVCIGEDANNGIKIINKQMVKTDHSKGPYEMIDKMCRMAEDMTDEFSYTGISCGGPLDSANGIILSPPNLMGWDNVKITEFIQKRWRGKAFLQNDANACAVAEWKYGAGMNCGNMVFLTFGTGMGAGLILNGKLYCGKCDTAGEIGHIRISDNGPVGFGKAGSFEGFCSGGGIAQIAKICAMEKFQVGKKVSYCASARELESISAKSVAEYAKKGFNDAKEVYKICGTNLGKGIAILIDILNPERIVIGSVFERSGELLKESMENVLKKECLKIAYDNCKIVPAKLGDSIGDYAAVAVAAMGADLEKEKND